MRKLSSVQSFTDSVLATHSRITKHANLRSVFRPGKRTIVGESMKIAGRLDLAELGLLRAGRFAILWHHFPADSKTANDSHFDLLLEMEGCLLTFQIRELPTSSEDSERTSILARRIADHRPLYLDYEGEISDNRGFVRRVAGGFYRLVPARAAKTEKKTRVELTAGKAMEISERLVRPQDGHSNRRAAASENSDEGSAILVLPQCAPNENCEIKSERWTLPIEAAPGLSSRRR